MKTRIFTTALVLLMTMNLISNRAKADDWSSKIASSLENAVDPALEIESWMHNDFVWHPFNEYVSATDPVLNVENWMVTPMMWTKNEMAAEDNLTLEGWMTDPENWKKPVPTADAKLMLEYWMLDSNYWLKKSNNQG